MEKYQEKNWVSCWIYPTEFTISSKYSKDHREPSLHFHLIPTGRAQFPSKYVQEGGGDSSAERVAGKNQRNRVEIKNCQKLILLVLDV